MNNPNENNTNPSKDDFERMIQLAEFGARRHDERRQVEFRVFISYNTLLVLAFYQIDKISDLDLNPLIPSAILLIVHLSYVLWELRISRSQVNDALRRNFYLKKAECILHHLREKPNESFNPRKDVSVMISLGRKIDRNSKCSEEGKISEHELFEMYEPPIELVSPMWRVGKHLSQLWKDWSRPFQILIPTVLIVLLIFALYNKDTNPLAQWLRPFFGISV